MKKLLSIVLIFIISEIALSADKVVGVYTMSAFEGTYEIKAGEIKNGKFSVYVFAESGDKRTPIFLSVSSDKVDEFNNFLQQINDKFKEWRKVAKDNNVTELKKEIDIKNPVVTIGWYALDWHFSFRNRLKAVYIIAEGKDYVAIAKEATSSSNRFMTETIYLAFAEPDEIDNLVSQLNVDRITAELNKSSNTSGLFQ